MYVYVCVCMYGYVPRYLLDPSWRVQVNKYNIFIYMCVCVCARVCVYGYVLRYLLDPSWRVQAYKYMYVYVCVCVYVRLRAALPARPLVVRPGIYICMYVYVCVYIYISGKLTRRYETLRVESIFTYSCRTASSIRMTYSA